jgi:hypothetical protein
MEFWNGLKNGDAVGFVSDVDSLIRHLTG